MNVETNFKQMYLDDTMLYNKLKFKDDPSLAWIKQRPMNPNIHIHNKHTPPLPPYAPLPPAPPPPPSATPALLPLQPFAPQLPPQTLSPSAESSTPSSSQPQSTDPMQIYVPSNPIVRNNINSPKSSMNTSKTPYFTYIKPIKSLLSHTNTPQMDTLKLPQDIEISSLQ